MWANVAKGLNSVIAMVDKLQEQDNNNQESAPDQALADVITSHSPGKADLSFVPPLQIQSLSIISDFSQGREVRLSACTCTNIDQIDYVMHSAQGHMP